mgnify:CR=1 FL=1
MSIKNLFNSRNTNSKTKDYKNQKDSFTDVESLENLEQTQVKQSTYTPTIDYSDPTKFAKFGSAKLYYQGALDKIINYYPYDGSEAEKNTFYNSLLEVEKYVLDELYPRTTGYATLSSNGWGANTGMVDGFGSSDSEEYITLKGGPHTTSNDNTAVAQSPNPYSSARNQSNIYSEDLYGTEGLPTDYGVGTRLSNLRMNPSEGFSIEFWLKTGTLSATDTEKQVIFDIWNNENSSSADYARATLYITSSGDPFQLSIGAGGYTETTTTVSTLNSSVLSEWNHYAIAVKDNEAGTETNLTFYFNGQLNREQTVTSKQSIVKDKNTMARIGALLTSPSGSLAPAGSGKLSGSIDEFRFWKTERDQKEIAENYFDNVGGGTNTDISNTDLGIYYKFNEGNTGDANTDSIVLDYSGRITNGVWTGYSATSRVLNSAIVESGAATKEYQEPIVRSNHPSYIALREQLLSDGEYHDDNNTALFINYSPSWVIEEHEDDGNKNLSIITHIMGAYFDKLYLLSAEIPKLKNYKYPDSSSKPNPFAIHLPQSMGLYTPDLFIDASILETFRNRNEETIYEGDLEDTKNLIYQNLYNNLANIYKSKGTEKAFRNVLRCFNIDDSLLRFKTYSRNEVYELKNNLKQITTEDVRLNLNSPSNYSAVVYQAEEAGNPESTGYISGTIGTAEAGRENVYGMTTEANIVFPKFFSEGDRDSRNFTEVSLYGVHTVDSANPSSLDGSDTTLVVNDYANFQVYAVRDENYSKNVRFKLSSSAPFPIIELTSSTFLNVYEDSRWNVSVHLKPENVGITGLVSGSTAQPYTIIFKGSNTVLDTVINTFELTGAVSFTDGSNFLQSSKRLYCGARRENITGAILQQSDVYVSDVKYWAKQIDNLSILQHIHDFNNVGTTDAYKNISGLDPNSNNFDALNVNTIALNWNFTNVTSSDATGNFTVQDYSSGSATLRDNYSWFGKIIGNQHTGYGYGFVDSSTEVVSKDIENSYKFVDPSEIGSSDMIQILSEDDNFYEAIETTPNYVFAIEKSMYQAISEEMLNFFAGAIDFNNLIGAPVNRYRAHYKDMENLREIFFKRVNNVGDVEKFIKYYKWFDESLSTILSQLVPASADFNSDILNVVESHVLERNKYATKFPTTEFKKPLLDSSVKGAGEKFWDSLLGSSPKPSSPRDTTVHTPFWKERAIRSSSEITSGDSEIDSQREAIRKAVVSTPNLNSDTTVSTIDGLKYTYNPFFNKSYNNIYRLRVDVPATTSPTKVFSVKGGTNFNQSKKIEYTYAALRPGGPVNTDSGLFIPENVLLSFGTDFVNFPINNDNKTDPIAKIERVVKVQHGRDWEDGLGYKNTKSTISFPFNIVSSSLSTGYQQLVQENVSGSINIVNLHNDVYGPDMEKPLQGIFTEHNVGGHQSRHVDFNRTGLDAWNTRPEAWYLLLGALTETSGAIAMVGPDYPYPDINTHATPPYPATGSQKAWLYRGFTAKRPINIRNIHRTGSNVLGNYRETYEIVNTFGKFSNPSHLINTVQTENQVQLPANLFQGPATSSQIVSTFLDLQKRALRTDVTNPHFEFMGDYSTAYLTGTANKSVISNRFSAPGGIETMTPAFNDFRSNEYSVYNALPWKNLSVIRPYQLASGSLTDPDEKIKVSDIHGKDYGLRSHLSRHTGRFGRDSVFVANPGTSYEELPGFHKVHRNTVQRYAYSRDLTDPLDTIIIEASHDNFYVSHQIPRSTKQYTWITGSVVDINADVTPDYTPKDFLVRSGSTLIEAYNFVSAGVIGSHDSGPGGVLFGVTRAAAASNFIFTDFVGLNTIILNQLSQSTNTLGSLNPIDNLNPHFSVNFPASTPTPDMPGNAGLLNSLLVNRGGAYGWAGWQALRSHTHPIIRKERAENRITIRNPDSSISIYNNPPVSMDGRPVWVNFDYNAPEQTNITLEMSYGEKQYFNTNALNNRFSFNQFSYVTQFEQLMDVMRTQDYRLNWVVYRECIFPADRNEFLTYSRERTGYDNKYWRDNRNSRGTLGATLTSSIGYSDVCQSSWPLDAPIDFLTRTHATYYATSSWVYNDGPALLKVSGCAGELQNTYSTYRNSIYPAPTGSGDQLTFDDLARILMAAPLYSRKSTLSSMLAGISPTGISNPYAYRQDDQGAWATGSAGGANQQYAVLDPLKANKVHWSSNKADRFAGEAHWETGELAGIIENSGGTDVFISHPSLPWFDEYDDYKHDIQKMMKDYAIVPEYRISENIADYKKTGLFNTGKKDTFEIVGTGIDSSANSFYKDYSNSDFIKNFAGVKANTLLNASEIKLSCKAAIRFNPYKGFYPAQRTMDIVEQFKETYAECYDISLYSPIYFNHIEDAITTGSGVTAFEDFGGATRSLNQAMFAPGILYNSIKSGMAVDYPVVGDNRKILRGTPYHIRGAVQYNDVTGATNQNNTMVFCGVSGSINGPITNPWYSGSTGTIYNNFFDKRIPFEAIINPEKHLKNVSVYDLEPDPLVTLGHMVTFRDKATDDIYPLMSRNFFGAVPEFFLKDSKFTELRSSTFAGDTTFKSGSVYMARVKIFNSYSGSKDYNSEYYSSVGLTSESGSIWTPQGPRAITASHDVGGNIDSISYLSGSDSWFPIPQYPKNKTTNALGFNTSFQEDFTLYSRSDAFGPPLAGIYFPDLASGINKVENEKTAYSSSFAYAGWQYTSMPVPPPGSPAAAAYTVSPWDTTAGNTFSNITPLPVMDSLNGYNWAYTPPYYNGEAWADLIFRPDHTKNYSLRSILAEIETKYWRVDPGYENPDAAKNPLSSTEFVYNVTGAVYDGASNVIYTHPASPYTGKMVNETAMQINASIDLFGIEDEQFIEEASSGPSATRNESVGQRWIIKPKFETPHVNFSDKGVRPLVATGSEQNLTMPENFGTSSVPQGMWHQFGVIDPSPNKGIFLQIGDIETNWLKYHYNAVLEPSVYNNNDIQNGPGLHKQVKSLTDLFGFNTKTTKKRLGEIKESLTVKEAVIAIPYVITIDNELPLIGQTEKSKAYFQGKEFIEIPQEDYEAALAGNAAPSVNDQIKKMKDYVMPPQFDFINNEDVKPIAMYIFEFDYTFDKDDLSYIWQNIAPRNYKKIRSQSDSVSHKLINAELLSERNLKENENLRWMVFKVKQNSKANYYDHTVSQVDATQASIPSFLKEEETYEEKYLQYNWPYDYLSFVELIKVDAEIRFGGSDTIEVGNAGITMNTTPELIESTLSNLTSPSSLLQSPAQSQLPATQQYTPSAVKNTAPLQKATPTTLEMNPPSAKSAQSSKSNKKKADNKKNRKIK